MSQSGILPLIYVGSRLLSCCSANHVVVADAAHFLDLCVEFAETIADIDAELAVIGVDRTGLAQIRNVDHVAAELAFAGTERA